MTANAPAEHTKKIRTPRRMAPDPNAFAYRIAEVRTMGGPCRTKVYELGKSGALKLFKVAGRTLVAGDSLRSLLEVNTTTAAAE
jgi:hypothetical protein